MNKKKTMIAAVVLMLVLLVGGLIAYFTDTDEKTNTFTVGNVEIEVVETNWDALVDENNNDIPDAAEDMMPGETVTKDPKVHNKSTKNKAYVFMKVESPCTTAATPIELFDYRTTPGVNTGWELMTDGTCTSGKVTRIYSYSSSGTMTELAADGNTPTLFDTLTLNTAIDGTNMPADTNVKVTGYAIQSEGLAHTTNTDVWSDAQFS